MIPSQPTDPRQQPPQPERRPLGRLVFIGPDNAQEVLAEVWSDQQLDPQAIVNAVTKRVSEGRQPPPSPPITTDRR